MDLHKYQNPDPRCQYVAQGPLDYCWTYAEYVDIGSDPEDLLAICLTCDQWQQPVETKNGKHG